MQLWTWHAVLPTYNTTVTLADDEIVSDWILQISRGWSGLVTTLTLAEAHPLFVKPWPYNFSISQSPQAGSGLRPLHSQLRLEWIFSWLALTQHSRSQLDRHILTDAFLNTVTFTSSAPFTTHILSSTAIVCLIVFIAHFFSCFIIWIPHGNVSFCSASILTGLVHHHEY